MVAVGAAVCRLPAWQTVNAEHFRSEIALAGVDSYSVDLQAVRARHCPLLSYFPLPHTEQTRSDVAFGATLSLSPDLQVDHAAHIATFSALLKVLAGHAPHMRSLLAVGLTLTNKPAPQIDSPLHSRLVLAVGAVFSYSLPLHWTSFAQTRS